MILWYLSHRRPAKAQASLRIRADSPEPSLFAHLKYGSRQMVRPKHQISSPTGWLHMCDWRMGLRRTTSSIISWDGLIIFKLSSQPSHKRRILALRNRSNKVVLRFSKKDSKKCFHTRVVKKYVDFCLLLKTDSYAVMKCISHPFSIVRLLTSCT